MNLNRVLLWPEIWVTERPSPLQERAHIQGLPRLHRAGPEDNGPVGSRAFVWAPRGQAQKQEGRDYSPLYSSFEVAGASSGSLRAASERADQRSLGGGGLKLTGSWRGAQHLPAESRAAGRKPAHLVRRWAFQKACPGWWLRDCLGRRGKAWSVFFARGYLFIFEVGLYITWASLALSNAHPPFQK